MKKYLHIFFDLDRTLWDFQQNSSHALREVINEFKLGRMLGTEEEMFVRNFNKINDELWEHFRQNRISKRDLRYERFRALLVKYNITDSQLIQDISRFYLNTAPQNTALMPNAKEVLDYLASKYKLYIISNGFYDVQLTKIINSGISKYITKVFTSDRIGHAKPKSGIFEYSISSSNARKVESIMVGDDPVNDIEGARNFGIDTVFYNPEKNHKAIEADFEIYDLIELKAIL